jgi:hypothetical protein
MADSEAEFYMDARKIQAGRRVTPSPRAPMTGHVPIRFSESVITRVKTLAASDGVTVSTWIRNLVLRELERRSQPTTGLSFFDPGWVAYSNVLRETFTCPAAVRAEDPDLSIAL